MARHAYRVTDEQVPTFKDTPRIDGGAHVSFAWLPGERFLIQHYFDSCGVARLAGVRQQ